MGELASHFGRIAVAEGLEVTQWAIEPVARAADGSMRDGLSLLDQAIAQVARGRAHGRVLERAAAGGDEGAGGAEGGGGADAAADGGAITAAAVVRHAGAGGPGHWCSTCWRR